MDKTWVRLRRTTNEYKVGLNQFLNSAVQNANSTGAIRCPCKKCYNQRWHQRNVVYDHLLVDGMDKEYAKGPWVDHGESYRAFFGIGPSVGDQPEGNGMQDLLNEVFCPPNFRDDTPSPSNINPTQTNGRTPEADRFYNLLAKANTALYPGCTKYKMLDFIVKLYQIKALSGWSDKSFTKLLKLLKDSYPEGETLPESFYYTKKLIGELGLTYEKIHACPNDCMLYWKATADETSCSHCGASRWKNQGSKVPAKVFRYFPLIPRLQRLYMSTHTAEHMRWHDAIRIKDGVLRHPAESDAWKNLDERYPEFGTEPRNVRLGLASDGFNPFGNMSNAYSTWPIVLSIYNLPPWMCMKQPYLFLSSLIPGPKGPGIDIDVYLQPLIDELTQLWDVGVNTYDVSSNQTFKMRAALMWTINDFPAYAILSGWSTKGRLACPNCNKKTWSKWLVKGRKFCYMGHRRFLLQRHRYRKQTDAFDGRQELRFAPSLLSGKQCLEQLEGLEFSVGKGNVSKTIRKKNTCPWKKKSIFFTLPYWEHHLVRHNLDVMHIEKNVCDSVVGTLLGIKGKTKDGPQARADLQRMKIKKHLHPKMVGGKKVFPQAPYHLNRKNRTTFCRVLSRVKFPDGYASNLSRCVDVTTGKITGWKSHDCHVVMQQLLPLAMRHVLPRSIMNALNELSSFFIALCSKTATPKGFKQLSKKIALALCEMEKIFPPAFFDVMVHLPVHLACEAALTGPVQYRWMYPIERYLRTLKGYVRNKSRPEGCIAEGYLVEECLSFCSMYLQDIDSKRTRPGRNTDPGGRFVLGGLPIFAGGGKSLEKGEPIRLDCNVLARAMRYVLFNCAEVKPFLDQHLVFLKQTYPRKTPLELERLQKTNFAYWFKNKVNDICRNDPSSIGEDLRRLALGPNKVVRRYKKYVINGFRFRTKAGDVNSSTQNSGVFITAQTSSYSRARDPNPIYGDVDYYGVLTDVIELDYNGGQKVVLFDCDWVDGLDQNRGVKVDRFGFTSVNLNRIQRTDDTFILASQALQVFYVQDPIEEDWHVAVKTRPRDLFDVNGVLTDVVME